MEVVSVVTGNVTADDRDTTKVQCDVCFAEFPTNEIAIHRESCLERLVFRCSVCNDDFMNREGLWNHLHLHNISDPQKELHCKEIIVCYNLHECLICNDQRAYNDILFKMHIHEAHDGLVCGETLQPEHQHSSNQSKATDRSNISDGAHGVNKSTQNTSRTIDSEGLIYAKIFSAGNIIAVDAESNYQRINGSTCDVALSSADELNDHERIIQLNDNNKDNAQEVPEIIHETAHQAKKNGTMRSHLTHGFKIKARQANTVQIESATEYNTYTYEIQIDGEDVAQECQLPEQKSYEGCSVKMEISAEESQLETQDVQLTPLKPPTVKCPKCPKLFYSKQQLAWHEKKHQAAAVNCDQCADMFWNELELQYHRDGQHACSEVSCDKCDANFPSYVEFYRHKKNFHGNRYKCSNCDKTFHLEDSLLRHFKLVHTNKSNIIVIPNTSKGVTKLFYKCRFCEKKYHLRRQLKQHLTLHDNELQGKDVQKNSVHAIRQSCDTGKRKWKGPSKEILQEAMAAIVSDQLGFLQASERYNIAKATLYDNILGKTNRMAVLLEIPLSAKEEADILNFCTESSNQKQRKVIQPLKNVWKYMNRRFHTFRERAEQFRFGEIPYFQWWWAFCRNNNVDARRRLDKSLADKLLLDFI